MIQDTPDNHGRVELKGIGVSQGIAVGPAFLVTTDEDRYVEREISEADVPREIARFEEALIVTRQQIHDIQQKVGQAIGQENASIFDAHLLVVDDRSFIEEVIRGLTSMRKNVESVLRVVTGRYAQALTEVNDDYLRERAADVRDVTRRILRNLAGRSSQFLASLEQPSIVIAHDLAPSDTASLNKTRVIGFVTDLGSQTSHTAIMARALGIPAIVGLHDVSVRVSHGDQVLIDGSKGVLIIRPSREEIDRLGQIAKVRQTITSGLATLKDQPAITKDGYGVLLSANIELPSDVDMVLNQGGNGVGLFRTEFLYMSRDEPPSEDEQYKAYEDVARRISPAPAIIRTLDLGGDKFFSNFKTPKELNPFMGWRAIRFCLAQPEIFKAQLRAILRASSHMNIKIMYPMISNVGEVVQANQLLEEAKEELRAKLMAFNEDIEIGVMIEVPSAALTAHLIAPHVDFFSLGTNDLVQYTLAVDRVNESVAYLYEPTHPAIMRLIKHTINVGHEHGIWTGICGEMAGNPLMAPLLIGLGVDELSVNPASVPLVKDVIRSISYSQAEDLALEAMESESAASVLGLCRQLIRQTAPEILELVD